ncbi:MAG TPA: hypothetical protein VJT81_00445 [Burkholderiales bacterium]|nr:hypothetical protein [Burkholderiales bacterium]
MTAPRPRLVTADTASAPAPPLPVVSQILVALRELATRVDALTFEVSELRASLPAKRIPRDLDIRLVRAISRATEGLVFSTWELIDHCKLSRAEDLREALKASIGDCTNSRKLGRRLAKLDGLPLDGLQLVRAGNEFGVACWAVEVLRV